MTPLFELTLPDDSADAHFAPLQIALEGLCRVNEWHIARSLKRAAKGLDVPIVPLYASGVYYKEDDAGNEDWSDVYGTLRRGNGDCKKLVAWRVAELRCMGVRCEPVIKWQWIPKVAARELGYPAWFVNGEGLWMVHCLVRYLDGTERVEDPSKILGMGGEYTNKR